ncbi:hypothetical protein A0256_22425 [Mucilaginibacter sp. PAMC 26640]|nr:hypothetical protein A0256_22425 [Mucilaginibacter sp. PAMC 26640]
MQQIVKPHDWPITPMPETIAETVIDRKLSARECFFLSQGFKPREMEERWFMYREADWVYLHRSWTGFCVFKAKVEGQEDGCKLTMLLINRNTDQYKSNNLESDINEFNSIIDSLIQIIRQSDNDFLRIS